MDAFLLVVQQCIVDTKAAPRGGSTAAATGQPFAVHLTAKLLDANVLLPHYWRWQQMIGHTRWESPGARSVEVSGQHEVVSPKDSVRDSSFVAVRTAKAELLHAVAHLPRSQLFILATIWYSKSSDRSQ